MAEAGAAIWEGLCCAGIAWRNRRAREEAPKLGPLSGAAQPAGVADLVRRLADHAARPALAARFDSQHRSLCCAGCRRKKGASPKNLTWKRQTERQQLGELAQPFT